jgi:hypothetical protein
MVKHNNVIPNQHFHKKWARRVKTWFNQPAQKKARRDARKQKAAAAAPAPVSGALRPLVQCPTRKVSTSKSLRAIPMAGCVRSTKYRMTVRFLTFHFIFIYYFTV